MSNIPYTGASDGLRGAQHLVDASSSASIAMTVYIVDRARSRPAADPSTDVDWVPIMLWTIGGSIVGRHRAQHRVGDPRGDARPERRRQVRPARPRHRPLRQSRRPGVPRRRRRSARSCCVRRGRLVLDRATRSSSASRSSTVVGEHRQRHRLPPGHRLMVKPTKVTNSIRAAARAGRTHAGGAREAHRRHAADAHRDRAGPVLADARARLPDLARLRRRPRRRLPVPRRRSVVTLTGRCIAAREIMDAACPSRRLLTAPSGPRTASAAPS